MDDEAKRRKALTFEQAEGVSRLPSQLARDEVSPQLRARLFDIIYSSVKEAESKHSNAVLPPWTHILRDKHIERDGRMPDDYTNDVYVIVTELRKSFSTNHLQMFGLLQWLIRHPGCPKYIARQVSQVLTEERAAYRLIDGDTFVPLASEIEPQVLERALADVAEAGVDGARSHLKTAMEALSGGKFADSVRESIHAVEFVARTLAPSEKLSDALMKLETSAHLHKAMKAGFGALYGFTGDEKGIRHPLLEDGDAKVDEADAIFMLGACAAFISYLIMKGRNAGLI